MRRPTGVLSIRCTGTGPGGIYLRQGRMRYAYLRRGDALVEGYAALRPILLNLNGAKVGWVDLETIPRETIDASVEDLAGIVRRLVLGDGGAVPGG